MASKILIAIVDDDRSMRMSLTRLAHSMGFDAQGFASAEEFLASDAVEQCSCLITDVQMPGVCGLELTRFMSDKNGQVPIIVITARSEPSLEQSALANGATCFLRKPIDTDVLISHLNRVFRT